MSQDPNLTRDTYPDKQKAAEQAYDAVHAELTKLGASQQEWDSLVFSKAAKMRPFYDAASKLEDEANCALPLKDFVDKVQRWAKNWMAIIKAIRMNRDETAKKKAEENPFA